MKALCASRPDEYVGTVSDSDRGISPQRRAPPRHSPKGKTNAGRKCPGADPGVDQEFTCFSYDDDHVYRHDESSLRWYYHHPLDIGTDLSSGFSSFDKHDDSQDEHLVSLLKSMAEYEKANGKVEAAIVTWRGMMTKVR